MHFADRHIADACKLAPNNEWFLSEEALIDKSNVIVLARAETFESGVYEFKNLRILKAIGEDRRSLDHFQIRGTLPPGKPIGWESTKNRGRAIYSKDCKLLVNFELGRTYLIFIGQLHPRGYELIQNPSTDSWYQKVVHKLNERNSKISTRHNGSEISSNAQTKELVNRTIALLAATSAQHEARYSNPKIWDVALNSTHVHIVFHHAQALKTYQQTFQDIKELILIFKGEAQGQVLLRNELGKQSGLHLINWRDAVFKFSKGEAAAECALIMSIFELTSPTGECPSASHETCFGYDKKHLRTYKSKDWWTCQMKGNPPCSADLKPFSDICGCGCASKAVRIEGKPEFTQRGEGETEVSLGNRNRRARYNELRKKMEASIFIHRDGQIVAQVNGVFISDEKLNSGQRAQLKITRIAYAALRGKMKIPNDAKIIVEEGELQDEAVVIFDSRLLKDHRGSDFAAKVFLNKKSGAVRQVLVSS